MIRTCIPAILLGVQTPHYGRPEDDGTSGGGDGGIRRNRWPGTIGTMRNQGVYVRGDPGATVFKQVACESINNIRSYSIRRAGGERGDMLESSAGRDKEEREENRKQHARTPHFCCRR
ncbi:hypothetical protein GSI_13105 [Ganoderma sinense ZZ0214-1]|uniref:Uncharacterized protein n=1 Tax=Ganoderma sinense ZZ0214-1 TaxID=1077348 RepID=A0A2G8RUM2_9APHY|nr:hypothetical protein GSI_13105 [Ganoderma sinense ZZ0214-1]